MIYSIGHGKKILGMTIFIPLNSFTGLGVQTPSWQSDYGDRMKAHNPLKSKKNSIIIKQASRSIIPNL